MNCRYLLLDTAVGGSQRYGIAAVAPDDDAAVILDSFVDLSASRAPVDELVRLCNVLELDLAQLRDVVEDFVAMA
ncbi:MAG: hypothetical protein IJX53_04560 [Clostridia bacterium]|nr:hypothetical protein [Clostridia bacterium]